MALDRDQAVKCCIAIPLLVKPSNCPLSQTIQAVLSACLSLRPQTLGHTSSREVAGEGRDLQGTNELVWSRQRPHRQMSTVACCRRRPSQSQAAVSWGRSTTHSVCVGNARLSSESGSMDGERAVSHARCTSLLSVINGHVCFLFW